MLNTDDRPGTVSIIDADRATVVDAIHVGVRPLGLALAPDETTLYVGNLGCPFTDCDPSVKGSLSVVDLRTKSVTRTIPLDGHPRDVALNRNGTRLYWTSGSELTALDTATFEPVASLAHPSLGRLAYGPRNGRLYAISPQSNDLAIIDPRALRVTATIPVGTGPQSMAIDNAGRAYVAAQESLVFAVSPRRGVLRTFDGGWAAMGVALDPKGRLLVVTNFYSGDILILRARTGEFVHRLPGPGDGATAVTFVRRRDR